MSSQEILTTLRNIQDRLERIEKRVDELEKNDSLPEVDFSCYVKRVEALETFFISTSNIEDLLNSTFAENRNYFKNWNGRRWQLLFLHNHSIAKVFSNDEEVLSSAAPGKYSILNQLNDSMKITLENGEKKFEFHIEYPDHKIHWRQTDNPTQIFDQCSDKSVHKVPGFELLSCKSSKFFGGLAKSVTRHDVSFINGMYNYDINWHFTIGMFYSEKEECYYNGGIPSQDILQPWTALWVRIK